MTDLQERLNDIVRADPEIELRNNDFLKAAFATHADAYVDNGICQLSMEDKLKIMTTISSADLLSQRGRAQVMEVGSAQIKYYQDNPSFAAKQAAELLYLKQTLASQSAEYLWDLLYGGGLRSTSLTTDDVLELVFSTEISYFSQTFGNQFVWRQ